MPSGSRKNLEKLGNNEAGNVFSLRGAMILGGGIALSKVLTGFIYTFSPCRPDRYGDTELFQFIN